MWFSFFQIYLEIEFHKTTFEDSGTKFFYLIFMLFGAGLTLWFERLCMSAGGWLAWHPGLGYLDREGEVNDMPWSRYVERFSFHLSPENSLERGGKVRALDIRAIVKTITFFALIMAAAAVITLKSEISQYAPTSFLNKNISPKSVKQGQTDESSMNSKKSLSNEKGKSDSTSITYSILKAIVWIIMATLFLVIYSSFLWIPLELVDAI
jgi:hypothetical protein